MNCGAQSNASAVAVTLKRDSSAIKMELRTTTIVDLMFDESILDKLINEYDELIFDP